MDPSGTCLSASLVGDVASSTPSAAAKALLAPLHMYDAEHLTLLHHAAKAGKLGVVKWLLAHGANSNVPDKNGASPLLLGVVRNNWSVVRYV